MAQQRNHLTIWATFLATLWMSSVLNAAEPASPTAPQPPKWYTDLQRAHQAAVRQDKPLLLLFVQKSCLYCRQLEAVTLASEKIQQRLRQDFVPVVLDLDQNKKAAKVLKIEGVPATVILTPRAELLARVEGFVPPEAYNALLVKAASRHAEISRVRQAALQKDAASRR